MKVMVDRDKCSGLGVCESITDRFFEVGADGDLVIKTETVPEDASDEVREAVGSCPTAALRLEQ